MEKKKHEAQFLLNHLLGCSPGFWLNALQDIRNFTCSKNIQPTTNYKDYNFFLFLLYIQRCLFISLSF